MPRSLNEPSVAGTTVDDIRAADTTAGDAKVLGTRLIVDATQDG